MFYHLGVTGINKGGERKGGGGVKFIVPCLCGTHILFCDPYIYNVCRMQINKLNFSRKHVVYNAYSYLYTA